MAASMWRMNGLCRSMAGLLLCTLLFSSGVMSQDDPAGDNTNPPASIPAGTDVPAAASASATGPPQAPAASGEPVSSSAADLLVNDTNIKTQEEVNPGTAAATPVVSDAKHLLVVPAVTCIKKKDVPEQSYIKAVLNETDDCDKTKAILENNPAKWCRSQNCSLNIYQEGNNAIITSSDAEPLTLAEALNSEYLKSKLGVSKVETPSSSSSSVLVGILVSGILAAIGISVGYFKYQRRPDTKGPKMAEEAYPVDQENQGNTLVSEAPLNPPPETQEKPNINGESPEADKTQTPPPTNGHSTAKTADTEL